MKAASELDLCGLLEASVGGSSGGVVLNDRLMTEASLGVISQLGSLSGITALTTLLGAGSTAGTNQGHEPSSTNPTVIPAIKTEHSYSLCSERPLPAASPMSGRFKITNLYKI